MGESREVCKICFASTDHKPTPTLTPESKATYDAAIKKKKCSVCRQEWAPIRVAKEVGTGGPTKWVRIRPRPKISASTDFQLCKNIQGKTECPRGHDCSYAHSRIELFCWNKDREREPRPAPHINSPFQYTLCKHVLTAGVCSYGQRCTFAHSEEELKIWLRAPIEPLVATNGGHQFPPPPPAAIAVGMTDFRCEICSLSCTSRKQLEDHFSGYKHKHQMASRGFPMPTYRPPPHYPPSMGPHRGHIRQRPLLSFPVHGYKICLHIQPGRRCIYGEYCTFAHSQQELEVWNRQLQHSHAPRHPHGGGGGGIIRFGQNYQEAPPVNAVGGGHVGGGAMDGERRGPDVYGSCSGLDDFEEEIPQENQDFASLLRSKVATEQKQKHDIQGFEKTKDNVTIVEVSGRDLALTWSQQEELHWVFEISVTSPRVLHSVVLFDMLATDFSLEGMWLVMYGGQMKGIPGSDPLQGTGKQVNQKIVPPDRIQIKISMKPRMGNLGQLILFDFGSFHMVRGLCVHVLSEQESRLIHSDTPRFRRTEKPDLYWEQHYHQIPMGSYEEAADRSLPEYPLPEQIEQLIEAGKYNNVENRVTKENYKRRMHNLLYLEEYQQRVDMSRYDLYNIEISPHKDFHTPMGVHYATEGFHYIKVTVDEVLYEGGRSIRFGDGALLLPQNQQVIHECTVERVSRDSVILRITEKAKQASAASLNRCSIRFFLSRVQMRSMHFAVDRLDLDIIFPQAQKAALPPGSIELPDNIKLCLEELKRSELTSNQQKSITSMLRPECIPVPSLVLGPFGCGKTRTLSECIKLLSLHVPSARVLVCTHSNSAANLYVESMDQEWRGIFHDKAPMFRLYYTGRRLVTISDKVREYCSIDRGNLIIPPLQDIKAFKIVVSTLQTSRSLALMGLNKGHFTHIFIDEAAQALEADSLVPLCLASEGTKVILAGDHMQMDPPCYSPIARKYNLQVSLLERLYDLDVYGGGVGQLCKTLLTENHRSHQQILELPSKLFYRDQLTCCARFPSSGPKDVPPLKLIGVDGQEMQDDDSPSFYNDHETIKICEQVKELVAKGLEMHEVCVLAYYSKQVQRIRLTLRQHRLSRVTVCRVDDIQGREFRALLLSTVRTCSEEPKEEEGGFLTNPKLFNTAVTRAKEWLIVVGEPITLCTVGSNRLCWLEFVRKCNHLGSFDYSNAQHFESFLETRLIARQILGKTNESFLKKVKTALTQRERLPPSAPSHPAPMPHPLTGPSPALPFVSNYIQAGPQKQQQLLRTRVAEVAQRSDEATMNKITDELLKLSVEQQGMLLSRQDIFQGRIRELERVLRRAGPTAAVMNTTQLQAPLLAGQATHFPSALPPTPSGSFPGPVKPFTTSTTGPLGPIGTPPQPPVQGDLPPFIARMIEAVSAHVNWCDFVLQNNPSLTPDARDNLLKQKANIAQQLNLVNDQVNLYRELQKIVKSSQQAQLAAASVAMATAPGPASTTMVPPKMAPGGPVLAHPAAVRVPVAPPTVPPDPLSVSHSQIPGGIPPGAVGPGAGPPPAMAQPPASVNSAFTYGVSAYLPTDQKVQPQQPQLTVQTKHAPGRKPTGVGSGSKSRSPLEAAIQSASARTTPLPPAQIQDDELYVSDDEFDFS